MIKFSDKDRYGSLRFSDMRFLHQDPCVGARCENFHMDSGVITPSEGKIGMRKLINYGINKKDYYIASHGVRIDEHYIGKHE